MSNEKIKFESRLASGDVARYLESLAAGIRKHEVLLESGTDSVSLHVADELTFEFSARDNSEKARAEFSLTVQWRTALPESARAPDVLLISGRNGHEEALSTQSVDRAVPTRTAVADSAPSTVVEVPSQPVRKPASRKSVDRAVLTPPAVADSAPPTVVEVPNQPASKPASGRPAAPLPIASKQRSTVTKAVTPKPAAVSSKPRAKRTSAGSRPPARRRAAS